MSKNLVLSNVHQKFGGRLKYMLAGGASLSKSIQHFFADIGIPVHEVSQRLFVF